MSQEVGYPRLSYEFSGWERVPWTPKRPTRIRFSDVKHPDETPGGGIGAAHREKSNAVALFRLNVGYLFEHLEENVPGCPSRLSFSAVPTLRGAPRTPR